MVLVVLTTRAFSFSQPNPPVGFETRSSAGCVKDTPMRLFRVFLDHGNPTLSQPSRPIPAVSRTPVFLAAGSFTDVLGISNSYSHEPSRR